MAQAWNKLASRYTGTLLALGGGRRPPPPFEVGSIGKELSN